MKHEIVVTIERNGVIETTYRTTGTETEAKREHRAAVGRTAVGLAHLVITTEFAGRVIARTERGG